MFFHDLKADDLMEVSVGIIKFPQGHGRVQQLSTTSEELQKKRSLVMIDNSDTLCLARSLVVCQAWHDFQSKNLGRRQWRNICDQNRSEQITKAQALIASLNISTDESSSLGNLPKYENHLQANIVVVSASHQNGIIYPDQLNSTYQKTYYLYFVDGEQPGHFHVIKSMTGLLNMTYFCHKCMRGYTHKNKHSCQGTCNKCKSTECLTEIQHPSTVYPCQDCGVQFRSQACFNRHKQVYPGAKRKQSEHSSTICSKFWQCQECRQYFDAHLRSTSDHVCHEHYCRPCGRWVPNEDHLCYIKRPDTPKPCQKFIFFDYECTQETGEHIPNLVVARKYDLDTGREQEMYFRSDDVREEFGKWLFSKLNKNAVVLAHNMKGYDGYFLLNYLVKNAIKHDVLFNGSKIMSINVENTLNIRTIDSLNFFPMPLAQLPKTFGLKDMKKGDFPHLFNIKANYGYIGPYPSIECYGIETKSEQGRTVFCQWYETQKDQTFNFEEELLDYCRNDVQILAEACLTFRRLLLHIGEVDPFNYLSIASTCMAVFKAKFLNVEYQVITAEETLTAQAEQRAPRPEIVNTKGSVDEMDLTSKTFVKSKLGITPANGYVCRDNYSQISIQWLEWLQHQDPQLNIHHALNGHGEYKIPGTPYRVDGYSAKTNTIYEFLGCLWHGCSQCYPQRNMKMPKTNETPDLLLYRTEERLQKLRNLGYQVITIWEHEFRRQCLENEQLQQFLQVLDIQPRLNLREAFYGGRTNATKLHYKISPGEAIRYVDFTSLYPWTNKYQRYPVGHPEIITDNFCNITSYFGMAKVKILPPRGLYHPVLPHRSGGKLMFPLCGQCALEQSTQSCTCTDEQRCLIGTWCIPELEKAMECGYEIIKLHEVYHWSETSCYDPNNEDEEGLFTEFIDTFLKLKQEASGWPTWCVTEPQKQPYIREYQENEGVHLSYDDIEANPGKRFLAKLMLNSFWGKFGQRPNLRQSSYIYSQADFVKLLMDPSKNITDFHIINDNLCSVEYGYAEDFFPDCQTGNVVIAAFTTCWARLHLLEVLHTVDRRCLYYDTDSVIYVESSDHPCEVTTGDYLGQLKNELKSDHYIEEFVSGGPNAYAYRENTGSETCKVKGFTLNYRNSKVINFETVRDLVLNSPQEKISLPAQNQIARNKKTQTVYNWTQKKDYRVVYNKRRLLPNLDTLPYGY